MATEVRKVPEYCYQCVAGPDLLTVKVEDGIATEIEPNLRAAEVHPGGGKCCVKAFGLVQKTYNPGRIVQPMKRTNPKKGRDQDPGFVPISWDEALTIVADHVKAIRAKGILDEEGFPRIAASIGRTSSPSAYIGTFPAFLEALGAVDWSFGSGHGVKCYHTEHYLGELWHRAFTVCPDTPTTRYVLSFGANTEASGGVVATWRHAEARVKGLKRVQIEPHLSITGACSAEWIPVRPKTDAAFLFGFLHSLLNDHPRAALDVGFLLAHTSSPYLVAPNGFFLRDSASDKPLVWDSLRNAAVCFDTPGIEPVLEGVFTASGLERGADDDRWRHEQVRVETSFMRLVKQLAAYTPEWAEKVCDIALGTVRRIAAEFLQHAQVGATIDIEGERLPLRPVAIVLGKTVNNGWGSFDCCWARTMAACLVGGLEVPGGTLGTTVVLNPPRSPRKASIKPGPDGFMAYAFNPTDRARWKLKGPARNAHSALVPLSTNSPGATTLGPAHLAWMFLEDRPANAPRVTFPDLWFVYRTNPAISLWDTPEIIKRIAKFPFTVAFAYVPDETNYMADVLLPECTDLESTQLIRIGGTKFIEQFWDHEGFALRQPAVKPRGNTRDITNISTELAARSGVLSQYNDAINRGVATGISLATETYDFRLEPKSHYDVEDIWDRVCRAASAEVTDGNATDGLAWYREHGYRTRPVPRLNWYLFPDLKKNGIRFEMPYQERLLRIGVELGRRLHESGIEWWDEQLHEYQAIPEYRDFPAIWARDVVLHGGTAEQYAFWMLTSRSMQYSWGANAGIPLMDEVARNIKGHRGVVVNTGRARELGIADGDLIEVRSYLRATRGRAILREGIRPDCLLIMGQFDHWVMPYAKDLQAPSLNTITPMSVALTDATGSGADIVRASLKKLASA
ncbi:MAG: molybdopterin oxidoreductase [Betaproteobacteria bacterium]|nr:MAG: molybdopterin oxidoreductase [Betaproteobacteria bacterium]